MRKIMVRLRASSSARSRSYPSSPSSSSSPSDAIASTRRTSRQQPRPSPTVVGAAPRTCLLMRTTTSRRLPVVAWHMSVTRQHLRPGWHMAGTTGCVAGTGATRRRRRSTSSTDRARRSGTSRDSASRARWRTSRWAQITTPVRLLQRRTARTKCLRMEAVAKMGIPDRARAGII